MNKTEIMETTTILNVEIKHVGRRISSIIYNDLNLRDYFFSELNNLKISYNFQRPDHSCIQISDKFKNTITHIFDVINELYKTNACLAAYLSSFIFESFTPTWKDLIREGRHILAIQLWRLIIEIVHDYECTTGNHIHKGSPYAFLADTYLIIGEIDNGFTYLYNAIEDDIKLNSVCPELNYPQNAPVYLTASISSNPQNIMAPLVHEIRTELGKYLEYFRNEFQSTLTLSEFDSLFLQNAKFEIIKYYFVFIFWTIYEQNIKVDNDLLNNDFSKLKNANWLFALCLIIDKLLSNHPIYSGKYIGEEVCKFILHKNYLIESDLDSVKTQEKIASSKPDILLPKLITLNLSVNGSRIPKEVQYLFVAWNLRNFAGHNIQTQNVISREFDTLLKILISDIFLVIEEFRGIT